MAPEVKTSRVRSGVGSACGPNCARGTLSRTCHSHWAGPTARARPGHFSRGPPVARGLYSFDFVRALEACSMWSAGPRPDVWWLTSKRSGAYQEARRSNARNFGPSEVSFMMPPLRPLDPLSMRSRMCILRRRTACGSTHESVRAWESLCSFRLLDRERCRFDPSVQEMTESERFQAQVGDGGK
ncbi:hypothetical protein MPTK1_4g02930 [Marchantia polymorpha subsp. ruderalis]|uniref:Uncharacterized protein n=2 Tax=Marchantia polymorpha TaxID=3197 RepID=A0AAF6B5P3_MARPO|nr:hypothetical protein MARPO_0080s0006 [Marchantia polymorpha]BBN07327.1 hypothetical protein Mp_4g02930 [Marchantia polymorpha subsp. ruderalis]|eukprot:PTQ34377.1 hypothetical protein MARPO_0080s0006 [Marchantia polymorpha]